MEAIYEFPRESRAYSIRKLGELATAQMHDWEESERSEFITRFEASILNDLLAVQDNLVRRGLAKQFIVEDADKRLIRWPEIGDLAGNHQELRRSTLLPSAARTISNASSDDFERFGILACQALGAEHAFLTPRTGDGSIDFIATIPAYTRSPVFCAGPAGLRVVGQCKKWASNVPEKELKLHAETVTQIRCRAPKYTKMFPAWFYDSGAPMVSWWIADRGFQKGARDYARDNGFVLTDKIELAYLFSSPKIFSPRIGQTYEETFNRLLTDVAPTGAS